MKRQEKLYRKLLRLLPAEFRAEYGREMGLFFRERFREETRSGTAVWRVWWDALADLLRTAPTQHWDLLRQDARSALRSMRAHRAFTAVAVATLALGIGANVGVFTFVDDLLIQSPPWPEAQRVLRLYADNQHGAFDVMSYPDYADLRDRSRSFTGLAAHRGVPLTITAGSRPEQLRGELVSGNYFEVLGIEPYRGRFIRESDDHETAEPVAVVSFGLWQRLGEESRRQLRIYGQPFRVVGVAPGGFGGSYPMENARVWLPLALHERVRRTGLTLDRRGWGWLQALGRLREGVGIRAAQAELDGLAAQLVTEHGSRTSSGYRLYPAGRYPEWAREGVAQGLAFLLLVTALVLLLVLANLGGAMLARVVRRRRETAVRQSLGATSTHLLRLWLTESALVALLGGALGLLVAFWTRKLLLRMVPFDLHSGQLDSWHFGPPIVLFTAGVTAVCAVAFGCLPAFRAVRAGLAPVLKEDAWTTSAGRSSARLHALLSVGQVTASVVLLTVAGLLLRTVHEAEAFHPGFEAERLTLAELNLETHGYGEEQGRAFLRRLEERLEGRPGVQGVTFAEVVPLSGNQENLAFWLEGRPEGPKDWVSLDANQVGADYFTTMGIPIAEGRDFRSEDAAAGSPRVVIVTQALARRFWPGRSALGRWVRTDPEKPPMEVVGVARDVRYQSLGEEPRPIVFGNLEQNYSGRLTVHVRGSTPIGRELLAGEVAALDPDLALGPVGPFQDVLAAALFPQRLLGLATGIFGVLALLLTSLGLYALLAFAVQQRRREFGIRMVLGARREHVLRMVLGRGLVLTLWGVALGAGISVVAARALESLLFGVAPTDPVALLLAAALPLAVALAASSLPARRATRVDPVRAIREP